MDRFRLVSSPCVARALAACLRVNLSPFVPRGMLPAIAREEKLSSPSSLSLPLSHSSLPAFGTSTRSRVFESRWAVLSESDRLPLRNREMTADETPLALPRADRVSSRSRIAALCYWQSTRELV